MKIILFSRPVHSGKTTELMQWCKQHKNVDGILMPDINGLRFMQRVATGETWQAQQENSDTTSEAALKIGRFSFYKKAFDKSNKILITASPSIDIVVIDEIGNLELKREGFYSSLKTILHYQAVKSLILVVRDSLVKEVTNSFDMTNFQLIHQCSDIG